MTPISNHPRRAWMHTHRQKHDSTDGGGRATQGAVAAEAGGDRHIMALRPTGFTLIETLGVLGIVAILATVGVPALQNLLMDVRMTTRVNEFVSHLHLARSEAIHRQQRITLCPSSDQIVCAKTPQWQHGWMVFIDENGNKIHENSEVLLRVQGQQHVSSTIKSGLHSPIIFQPEGTSGGTNSTITFCDTRGASNARAVVLSNGGRVRLTYTQPGTKKPLSCA